jgi:hypothetical protein
MADNILTKDRDDADIAIAAKDVAGVLVPRNMLVDTSGADITPATEATLGTLAAAVSNHNAVAADGHTGIVMLVRRRDSDVEPMVDDGDLTFLNIDE